MRTSNAGLSTLTTLTTLVLALSLVHSQKNCLGATSDKKCTVCAHGYPDGSGKCITPSTKVNNCYVYSGNGACSECEFGFYRNLNPPRVNETCVALDKSIKYHCRYSTISTKLCSHCDYGVLTDAGHCFPLNSCSDPKCKSCYFDSNGLEQCFECNYDSMLWTTVSPGICLPSANLTNCLSTNNWVSCGRCRVGYYWKDNRCHSTSKTNVKGAGRLFVLTGLLALLSLWKC